MTMGDTHAHLFDKHGAFNYLVFGGAHMEFWGQLLGVVLSFPRVGSKSSPSDLAASALTIELSHQRIC